MRRACAAALGMMVGLAAQSQAWAQEEVCSGEYPASSFAKDTETVRRHLLVEANMNAAAKRLAAIEEALPCSRTLIDTAVLAEFGRWMGFVAFLEQDESTAIRWGLMSRYTDPDLPWPEDMAEDHRYREILASAEDPPVGMVDNRGLAIPTKGGIFMNGQLVLEPRARAENPYLVQVIDKRGTVSTAYWQDGVAFPDFLLAEVDLYPPLPVWYDGPAPEGYDPSEYPSNVNGGVRKAPTVVGAGLLTAGATLYALATISASGLDEAESPDELTQTRSRTNALVVASGITAIAGATAIGIGVSGALTGTPRITVTGRF